MINKERLYRLYSEYSSENYPEFLDECLFGKLYNIIVSLEETSKSMNLTAITDPEGILDMHILDSLFCACSVRRYAGDKTRHADIGSGAGFPALVIAAALPESQVSAVDSTAKKCRYIERCAAEAEIDNISAFAGRAEELSAAGKSMRESFDSVSARAVADLCILLELTSPFVRKGGYIFAMKGPKAAEEQSRAGNAVKELGLELVDEARTYTLLGGHTHSILIYRKIAHLREIYPRTYGKILKKPL